MTDFGTPAKIDALPPSTNAGGRKSLKPALRAWLAQLENGGTYELVSKDEDKAHPVGRATQMREVAKEMNDEATATTVYQIDTRAVTPGKRYRIFATASAKAKAAAPAKK